MSAFSALSLLVGCQEGNLHLVYENTAQAIYVGCIWIVKKELGSMSRPKALEGFRTSIWWGCQRARVQLPRQFKHLQRFIGRSLAKLLFVCDKAFTEKCNWL